MPSAANRFPPTITWGVEGRTPSRNISQSIGFTHHYWLSLTGIEPEVICMLWYCIGVMISGFTEHLRENGWWRFNQGSSVWCACQDNSNLYRAPCLCSLLQGKVATQQAGSTHSLLKKLSLCKADKVNAKHQNLNTMTNPLILQIQTVLFIY